MTHTSEWRKGYLAGLRRGRDVCLEREAVIRECYAGVPVPSEICNEKIATAARCALEIEEEIRKVEEKRDGE